MKTYADENFYLNQYLLGKGALIPTDALPYWLMQASIKINRRTFGRAGELEEIPKEVSMCCCAVAEQLYRFESAKGENGMILQSYGNDGETATYKTTDMSEMALSDQVSSTINEWLMPTGLLYCGVDM